MKKIKLIMVFLCLFGTGIYASSSDVSKNAFLELRLPLAKTVTELRRLQEVFVERRYIFRHSLGRLLDKFGEFRKQDKTSIEMFKNQLIAFEDDFRSNDMISEDVREYGLDQLRISISSLLNGIVKYKSSIERQKMSAMLSTSNQKINNKNRMIRDLEARVKSAPKVIIQKSDNYLLGSVIIFAMSAVFCGVYFRSRSQHKRKYEALKTSAVAKIKKERSLYEEGSFSQNLKNVLGELEGPMSAVINLNGKVEGATKSFKQYFSRFINLRTIDWDDYFEKSFVQNKTEKGSVSSYLFFRDPLSEFVISTQLLKEHGVRYVYLNRIDSSRMIEIKNKHERRLINGFSSAKEMLSEALVYFTEENSSHLMLKNLSLNTLDEVGTFSASLELRGMFIKTLELTNVIANHYDGLSSVTCSLERNEDCLIMKLSLMDIEINLNHGEIKNAIRIVSSFVSELSGEISIRSSRSSNQSVDVELLVHDKELSLASNYSVVVKNEITC